ncbi:MAG: EscU/YscU/HrcU family type III secretion system export apparatus switch protein [Burkholderiales bacterium]|jgi:flagellar biosynthesis protein FlhB|uniref:EscU/YscU/HrcU family type III secretion system export apparatus switch protein n=1 Tax=Limnobacter sp. TaxID=2003368 RepID=UPI0039BD9124|nr:EscU/YscU/HrcU family type III secretion system export apparatus switch protein [Burkholderiales bacterium]
MSGEKTEEATDKKLEDAREEGQVPISKDLQTLVKLFLVYGVIFWGISDYDDHFSEFFTHVVGGFSDEFAHKNHSINTVGTEAFYLLLKLTAPFVLAGAIASCISTWMQVGFVYAPKALKPSFKKFNFVENIKSMFSKKSFIQLVVSFFKVLVCFLAIYSILKSRMDEIVFLYRGGLEFSLELIGEALLDTVFLILSIFIVFSFIDWMATYFDFKKRQRMSKADVKDEFKKLYGNTELKQEMKAAHRNLMNASLSKVQNAKAVVVNPTHIAVALDYEPGRYDVPFILAMGEGDYAQLIRNEAEKHGIPVIRSVALARSIYFSCEEDEYIQDQHLEMAAQVFRLVFGLEK